MDKLFGSLKSLLKINAVVIDNNVFRLHYKFTVLVLLAFSIIVSTKQYIGDPIDCISRDDIPQRVLDSFCWIHSTFSVVKAWGKKIGDEIPYPGVDKYTQKDERVFHTYYQWVCFVLFLQAIMFYVPRYLWKIWEGGRLRAMILGLNEPIIPSDKKVENRKILVDYLVENMGHFHWYALEFLVCEILNFCNVIGQMYLLDTFLGGEFSTYGTKVIQFTEWDQGLRFDPMVKVFPRLTKCTFHRYGSSGDVQRHDAMCILPINIINEKIYVFLWFWFIMLAVLSALILAFHFVMLWSRRARFLILRSKARFARADYLDVISNNCSVSDWFVLDLLCRNLDPLNYRDLVVDLARRLERKTVDEMA